MDIVEFCSKINTWIKNNIAIILILLFYISEAANKYFEFTTGYYSIIPRTIKLSVMLYISFSLFRRKDFKFFKITGTLIICYLLGQYFLNISFSNNSILVLGRYLYPLLLFRFFTKYQLNKKQSKSLFQVFESLIAFNSLLIILGFMFGVALFETYSGNRFGYNGLLLTSSTASYVYIITLFYFILKYKLNPKFDYKFFLILSSCLLIGTKSLYLVFLAIIVYMISSKFPSRKSKIISVLIFALLSVSTLYILFYQVEFFSSLREERGLLSVFLSFRDILLVRDVIPYINENWTALNYLFGGVHDISTQSEMGFIDTFYFWGIIGGLFYLTAYYKLFFTFKFNSILLFFILLLIFVIFIAGNFFFYSTIPIYLIVFRERVLDYFYNKT
ncbi:hypothetical protein ACFS5M_02375 [Lacinutrix iliipiscaria]|uniref:Uncharacterized protein n=1 Tax=Lacinutrix iliipiscaria TaxID=1230532 RepID=A0ABW5WIP2_9FLAO